MLFIFNLPFPDISFFGIEINSDFHKLSAVCRVRDQIAPVVNLLQGLLRTAIQFEFKYIDVFGSFNHGISPSGGTTYFSIYKLSQEFENEIEYDLIMSFCLGI